MGEAEAIYRLLPSMQLKKSNVTCQWVSLGTKEERSSRWKKATQAEMDSGIPVIQLNGHEGYWYEQQDMWSKYLRRPKDTLGSICFAQFPKMYKSASKSRTSEEDNENLDATKMNNDDASDDGYCSETGEDCNLDDKFNYIMTHETGNRKDYRKSGRLPDYIALSDPYPGEAHMMQKI